MKLEARSKLHYGDLIRAINAWALSVVRYSAGILDWSDRKLRTIDGCENEEEVDDVWSVLPTRRGL